jgi:hypothetical protein
MKEKPPSSRSWRAAVIRCCSASSLILRNPRRGRSHQVAEWPLRTALTTSLSQSVRASHVLRPVRLPIHPKQTDVPPGFDPVGPLPIAPVATGAYREFPRPGLHPSAVELTEESPTGSDEARAEPQTAEATLSPRSLRT